MDIKSSLLGNKYPNNFTNKINKSQLLNDSSFNKNKNSLNIDSIVRITISLLANGLSQEQIIKHLSDVYGFELSFAQVDLLETQSKSISKSKK